MKCDYCKIQYDTPDNVCPVCGMSPRKRWLKILCRLGEGFLWLFWAAACCMIPAGITLGNPIQVIIGCILLLPALYYIMRKLIGRKHRYLLCVLRMIAVLGGYLLVLFFSTTDYEFSREDAIRYAKEALEVRYEHDASFSYQNCSITVGEMTEYDLLPVAVKLSYRIDDGYGKLLEKKATYVFYWNQLKNCYEHEHWEFVEADREYWGEDYKEEAGTTGGITGQNLKWTKERVIWKVCYIFPIILLLLLIRWKNHTKLSRRRVIWKTMGIVLAGAILSSYITTILGNMIVIDEYGKIQLFAVFMVFIYAGLEELVKFTSAWLASDKFQNCDKVRILYSSVFAAAVFSVTENLFREPPTSGKMVFFILIPVLLAPNHLLMTSVFAYYYMKKKWKSGLVLSALIHGGHNLLSYLIWNGAFMSSDSPRYLLTFFVAGFCYYFFLLRIHFYAVKRIEYTEKTAGETDEKNKYGNMDRDAYGGNLSDGLSERIDETREKL